MHGTFDIINNRRGRSFRSGSALLLAFLLAMGQGAQMVWARSSPDDGESPAALRKHALGVMLENSQNFETALPEYKLAIKKAQDMYGADSTYVADLNYELGALALDTAHFSEAERYLSESVKLNPNSISARLKYARLLELRHQRNPEIALAQIQSALTKNSNSPQARYALVQWLMKFKENNPAAAIKEANALDQLMKAKRAEPPTKIAVAAPSAPQKQEEPKAAPAKKPAEKPQEKPEEKSGLPSVLGFLRSPQKDEPKKEPKKEEQPSDGPKIEPVKAKPAAKSASKSEPKPKESKKQRKADRAKEKKKEREKAQARSQAKVKPETKPEAAELKAVAGSLTITGKVKDNKPEKKEKPQRSENETEAGAQEAVQSDAPVPGMPAVQFHPAAPAKKGKRGVLVPPPPPTPALFPMAPMMAPPKAKPKPAAPPPKKEKSIEEAKEQPKEQAAEKPAGGGEDPEFMLQWAGVKKKGK